MPLSQAPSSLSRPRCRVAGLAGALGFKFVGFACTLPLAIGLWMLTLRPLLQDLRQIGLQPGR